MGKEDRIKISIGGREMSKSKKGLEKAGESLGSLIERTKAGEEVLVEDAKNER